MAERRPFARPARCRCGSMLFYRRAIVQVFEGQMNVTELDIEEGQTADPDSLTPVSPYQCVKCSTEYTHADLMQLGVRHE